MQIIVFCIILLVDKMNKIELMIFYQTVKKNKKTVKTEMLSFLINNTWKINQHFLIIIIHCFALHQSNIHLISQVF